MNSTTTISKWWRTAAEGMATIYEALRDQEVFSATLISAIEKGLEQEAGSTVLLTPEETKALSECSFITTTGQSVQGRVTDGDSLSFLFFDKTDGGISAAVAGPMMGLERPQITAKTAIDTLSSALEIDIEEMLDVITEQHLSVRYARMVALSAMSESFDPAALAATYGNSSIEFIKTLSDALSVSAASGDLNIVSQCILGAMSTANNASQHLDDTGYGFDALWIESERQTSFFTGVWHLVESGVSWISNALGAIPSIWTQVASIAGNVFGLVMKGLRFFWSPSNPDISDSDDSLYARTLALPSATTTARLVSTPFFVMADVPAETDVNGGIVREASRVLALRAMPIVPTRVELDCPSLIGIDDGYWPTTISSRMPFAFKGITNVNANYQFTRAQLRDYVGDYLNAISTFKVTTDVTADGDNGPTTVDLNAYPWNYEYTKFNWELYGKRGINAGYLSSIMWMLWLAKVFDFGAASVNVFNQFLTGIPLPPGASWFADLLPDGLKNAASIKYVVETADLTGQYPADDLGGILLQFDNMTYDGFEYFLTQAADSLGYGDVSRMMDVIVSRCLELGIADIYSVIPSRFVAKYTPAKYSTLSYIAGVASIAVATAAAAVTAVFAGAKIRKVARRITSRRWLAYERAMTDYRQNPTRENADKLLRAKARYQSQSKFFSDPKPLSSSDVEGGMSETEIISERLIEIEQLIAGV